MTIPEILYKYRPMNKFTKRILSHGELYFSKMVELNDPFEYIFAFEKGAYCALSEEEKKFYQPEIREDLCWLSPEKYTQRYAISMKNSTNGVFCLSKTKESIYMYSHYADSFKGICIGFNSKVFASHPSLIKMSYKEEAYKIRGNQASINDWVEILSTKHTTFAREEEWRIVDDIAGVLSDGCKLLVLSEDPNPSIFPEKFDSGFIYNSHSSANYTKLWYFDKNKRLIPLSELGEPEDEELAKIIKSKPVAPTVAHFSNTELQFLNQFSLTTSGRIFPNKPISLEPKMIKNSITEIIFGFNIPKSDVDFTMKVLKNTSPKFYVAKPIIGEYRVDIHAFNSYEEDIARYQIIYGYNKKNKS